MMNTAQTRGMNGFAPAVLLLLLVLPAAAAVADAQERQGLLWEIGGQGHQPSYLFGTIHSEDPAVLALAAPVERAFAAADTVVLELVPDREAMLYSSRAMLLDEGRVLSQIAGPRLFEATAAAIAGRGIPEVVLERMKPWAAAVTLSMPVPETGEVLDLRLYERALQDGKAVHGLETIREQLEIFDSLSEDRQLALLRDAVEHVADLDAMYDELLAAWRRRDLAALHAISAAALQTGDRELAVEFQQRLISGRNLLMAERMQRYLRDGNAFIAVGALHLPGEDGLLRLLEARGYTLTARY